MLAGPAALDPLSAFWFTDDISPAKFMCFNHPDLPHFQRGDDSEDISDHQASKIYIQNYYDALLGFIQYSQHLHGDNSQVQNCDNDNYWSLNSPAGSSSRSYGKITCKYICSRFAYAYLLRHVIIVRCILSLWSPGLGYYISELAKMFPCVVQHQKKPSKKLGNIGFNMLCHPQGGWQNVDPEHRGSPGVAEKKVVTWPFLPQNHRGYNPLRPQE